MTSRKNTHWCSTCRRGIRLLLEGSRGGFAFTVVTLLMNGSMKMLNLALLIFSEYPMNNLLTVPETTED
ncbi:unnamed protein product [Brassica napus]|nr:unnamed protein product [Brassica napus]